MEFKNFEQKETSTKTNLESKINVAPEDRNEAVTYFEEATKKNPDVSFIRNTLSNLKDPKKFLEALAVVTIDKTNPNSDIRWGMIRKTLMAYDNLKNTNYLEIFNKAAREEVLRRGRIG